MELLSIITGLPIIWFNVGQGIATGETEYDYFDYLSDAEKFVYENQ